jgi:hypothetical protein
MLSLYEKSDPAKAGIQEQVRYLALELFKYKPVSFSRFTYNINANNPPPITAVIERLRQVMGPFDSLGFLGGSVALQYALANTRVSIFLRDKEPII